LNETLNETGSQLVDFARRAAPATVAEPGCEPASPRENTRSRTSFHFAAACGTHRHRESRQGGGSGRGPLGLSGVTEKNTGTFLYSQAIAIANEYP
jgi:hypothetical protein